MNMIKQLSIFIENKEGHLSKVLEILANKNIDIRSMIIVETHDYGILRLILADTNQGKEALKKNGIMVTETKVMAVEMEDKPGALYHFIDTLSKNHINIEYSYSFMTKRHGDKAYAIFKVKDAYREKVMSLFENSKNVRLLDHEELILL